MAQPASHSTRSSKSSKDQLSSLPNDYSNDEYSDSDPRGEQHVEESIILSEDEDSTVHEPPVTPLSKVFKKVKLTDRSIQEQILRDIKHRTNALDLSIIDWNAISEADRSSLVNMAGPVPTVANSLEI